MPTYFNLMGYKIFIWANENGEPIHFHISKGSFSNNATKVWVLSDGSLLLCHNKSRVPSKDLNRIMSIMQSDVHNFINYWVSFQNYLIFYK